MRASRVASLVSPSGQSRRAAALFARLHRDVPFHRLVRVLGAGRGPGVELVGPLGEQRRAIGGALGEHVGDRLGLVEQAERRNQHQPSDRLRPDGGDVGGERSARRCADQRATVGIGRPVGVARGEQPVDMLVQQIGGMPARRPRERRGGDAVRLRQPVEHGEPAGQAGEAGEPAESGALPLLPHPQFPAGDRGGAFERAGHTATGSGTARLWLGIGFGHQWSSHSSSNRSAIWGSTFSAKSWVLWRVRSFDMLPK